MFLVWGRKLKFPEKTVHEENMQTLPRMVPDWDSIWWHSHLETTALPTAPPWGPDFRSFYVRKVPTNREKTKLDIKLHFFTVWYSLYFHYTQNYGD